MDMDMLVKLPEPMLEHIEHELGIPSSQILLASFCRERFPELTDTCLFADARTLYIMKGRACCADMSFERVRYERYALDDASDIEVEELVSSVRLSLTYKSEPTLLCESANTYKESLMLFAAYLRQIKNKDFNGVDREDLGTLCPNCGRRYPDRGHVCPHCADRRGTLEKLLPFFKRYAGKLALVMLMLILTSLLGILSPYIGNSFYIDSVLTEGGSFYGQILYVIALMLSVRLSSLAISVINEIVSARVAADITYDLKSTIFSAINKLSLGFFNSRRTGGLVTQIEKDASTLYRFFGTITPNLLVAAVKIVAIAAVMLALKPTLALVTMLSVPIYVFAVERAYKKSRSLANTFFAKDRTLNSRLSDVLGGLRIVKAFAKERVENERFGKLSAETNSSLLDLVMFDAVVFPAVSMLLYLGTVAVWALGGIYVMRGELSYGDLLSFVAYMGILYSPLNYIVNNIRRMSEAMNAASRLFEIADATPDVVESAAPVRLGELRGEIEFKNVSFSYTKSKRVLDGVSFKVEPGEALGIVGRTGAGKSTIVNLLTRLYDASDGEILIDGVNIKQLSFEDLRRNIAIVSQETYLFEGSIFDNIAYALPNADPSDVISAAIEAGAHDFIMKLPDGYETRIGHSDRELSGGERQRISIARALLKKPRILILDEATAAMDTATEQKIERAIAQIAGSSTTIMIAHRLSTLKSAKKLIVIENGRVCEAGTHTELIEAGGVYNRLYTLQLEALKNILSEDGIADSSALSHGQKRA